MLIILEISIFSVQVPLSGEAKKYLPESKGENVPYFTLPTDVTIAKALKQWTKDAGIEKHITYHKIPTTFGTLTMESIKDIETVSKLLVHKDIRNTVRYAGNSMDSNVQCISMMDGLFG